MDDAKQSQAEGLGATSSVAFDANVTVISNSKLSGKEKSGTNKQRKEKKPQKPYAVFSDHYKDKLLPNKINTAFSKRKTPRTNTSAIFWLGNKLLQTN